MTTNPFEGATPDPLRADTTDERRRITGVFLGTALMFAVSFGLQFLIGQILRWAGQTALLTPTVRLLLSSLSLYAVGMPISLIAFRLAAPDAPEQKPLSAPVFCGVTAICFALALGGNLQGQTVNAVLSALSGKPTVDPLAELTTGIPFPISFFTVALLAPILEEVFFRKLVIDRLRRYGDVFAVTVSGVLFGVVHGNFSQFFYAAAIGILFGIVYCATGRIRYTTAIHVSFNAIGVILSEILVRTSGNLQNLTASFLSLIAVGGVLLFYLLCIVCAPIAAYFLFPRLRPGPAVRRMDRTVLSEAFLLNPAFWLSALVLIGRFVLQTFG